MGQRINFNKSDVQKINIQYKCAYYLAHPKEALGSTEAEQATTEFES